MSQAIEIQMITAEKTWNLRHLVLRPNASFEAIKNPEDQLPNTFHLGAYIQNELVGISSFHEEELARLSATRPYRLRGMATDPNFQRRGIGTQLMEKGVLELQKTNSDLLWCNAREVAFPFYQGLGLLTLEPLFEISGVGPHKVMYKYLSQR